MKRSSARLALADGTVFEGFAYGAEAETTGEVVFTTGMTGYQEVLTDPSYCGQIVTMTAPQIGNTGINDEDDESIDGRPTVAGFIVRDPSLVTSNWRAKEGLDDYLKRHGIVAIGGIDTRRLTRYLRDHGAQNGCIGTASASDLVDRARLAPSMEGLDLVQRVTPIKPYEFAEARGTWNVDFDVNRQGFPPKPQRPADLHVVTFDYGIKRNILRCLVDVGCRVTAVPATTSAADVLALNPDGIFLSNGPGDPAPVT
ncbi:MAG TPA: carbamoyl phosphate synthase small subunit, partial [Polyangiaceae bacterium]